MEGFKCCNYLSLEGSYRNRALQARCRIINSIEGHYRVTNIILE